MQYSVIEQTFAKTFANFAASVPQSLASCEVELATKLRDAAQETKLREAEASRDQLRNEVPARPGQNHHQFPNISRKKNPQIIYIFQKRKRKRNKRDILQKLNPPGERRLAIFSTRVY